MRLRPRIRDGLDADPRMDHPDGSGARHPPDINKLIGFELDIRIEDGRQHDGDVRHDHDAAVLRRRVVDIRQRRQAARAGHGLRDHIGLVRKVLAEMPRHKLSVQSETAAHTRRYDDAHGAAVLRTLRRLRNGLVANRQQERHDGGKRGYGSVRHDILSPTYNCTFGPWRPASYCIATFSSEAEGHWQRYLFDFSS